MSYRVLSDMQKSDGFPEERKRRLTEVPEQSEDISFWDAIITEAGHFPKTHHHYIDRPTGSRDHILIINISGNGYCRLVDKNWVVKAGQGIWIPAHTPHAYGSMEQNPWNIYWMHCRGNGIDDFAQWLTMSGENPVFSLGTLDNLLLVFEKILQELFQSIPQSIYPKNTLLLCRMFSIIGLEMRSLQDCYARQSEERVIKSIQWMQDNIAKAITLEGLASAVHLSVPHYCCLFKKEMGVSPLRFLTRLRLQLATNLLVGTKKTISEIAESIGYNDPFYFCRIFKKHFRLSPTQYRKTHP